MRNRLEDLGRLVERLDAIYEKLTEVRHPEQIDRTREKDFVEKFFAILETEQADVIRHFVYGIQEVCDMVENALEIAKGEDYLNRED